jgi:putative membrane protein
MRYYRYMKIIKHLVVSAIAIAIAAYILPGVSISGIIPLLVLAIVLGVINTFIRPVLTLLTLPLTILTLGIFSLILNALLIMLAAAIVPGVVVNGFLWALLFGLLISLVHMLLHHWDK